MWVVEVTYQATRSRLCTNTTKGPKSVSLESLTQLEQKIVTLIDAFKTLKQESDNLREELEDKTNNINSLQSERDSLQNELSALKGTLDKRQKKLDVAAERIQEILRKFESIGQ